MSEEGEDLQGNDGGHSGTDRFHLRPQLRKAVLLCKGAVLGAVRLERGEVSRPNKIGQDLALGFEVGRVTQVTGRERPPSTSSTSRPSVERTVNVSSGKMLEKFSSVIESLFMICGSR
jgi:hypothetical protein